MPRICQDAIRKLLRRSNFNHYNMIPTDRPKEYLEALTEAAQSTKQSYWGLARYPMRRFDDGNMQGGGGTSRPSDGGIRQMIRLFILDDNDYEDRDKQKYRARSPYEVMKEDCGSTTYSKYWDSTGNDFHTYLVRRCEWERAYDTVLPPTEDCAIFDIELWMSYDEEKRRVTFRRFNPQEHVNVAMVFRDISDHLANSKPPAREIHRLEPGKKLTLPAYRDS